MAKIIKILIADDNPEIRNALVNFLEKFSDVTVCATASDGMMAINKIFEFCPDVVILDVVMPMTDGIYVLKKIKTDYKKPIHFIMVSNNGCDAVLKKAYSLGAEYYMVKPIRLQSLLDWIRYLYKNNSCGLTDFEMESNDLNSIIKRKLVEIGVPTNYLGYHYLIEALTVRVTSNSHVLISEVYEEVARRHHTESNCVESAIRNVLTHTFENRNKNYEKLFLKDNSEKKTTNSKFISLLAEEIKLNFY